MSRSLQRTRVRAKVETQANTLSLRQPGFRRAVRTPWHGELPNPPRGAFRAPPNRRDLPLRGPWLCVPALRTGLPFSRTEAAGLITRGDRNYDKTCEIPNDGRFPTTRDRVAAEVRQATPVFPLHLKPSTPAANVKSQSLEEMKENRKVFRSPVRSKRDGQNENRGTRGRQAVGRDATHTCFEIRISKTEIRNKFKCPKFKCCQRESAVLASMSV
jgi:hypothetical protein